MEPIFWEGSFTSLNVAGNFGEISPVNSSELLVCMGWCHISWPLLGMIHVNIYGLISSSPGKSIPIWELTYPIPASTFESNFTPRCRCHQRTAPEAQSHPGEASIDLVILPEAFFFSNDTWFAWEKHLFDIGGSKNTHTHTEHTKTPKKNVCFFLKKDMKTMWKLLN